MDVKAYLNHGYWKVDCPKCGNLGATLAQAAPEVSPYFAENMEYVCPHCYPGMLAGTMRLGVFEFNKTVQAITQKTARKKGEVYSVIFPVDKIMIEKIVNKRPPENRNWIPGESSDFLKGENRERGIR